MSRNSWDTMLEITLTLTLCVALGLALLLWQHYQKYRESERYYREDVLKVLEGLKESHGRKACSEPNVTLNNDIMTHGIEKAVYKKFAIGVVAETLWQEARGEGKEGILAVASVICNRSVERHKRVEEICLEPKQFSCWNGKDPRTGFMWNDTNEKRAKEGRYIWNMCVSIATEMVAGRFKPSVSANHYYNPSKCRPSWGCKMKRVVMIGNHRFGRI